MRGKLDKYLMCFMIGVVFLTFFVSAENAEGVSDLLKSWSQQIAKDRFVVLSQFNYEAVLDKETQLVWEKSPNIGAGTWLSSSQWCNSQTTGGRLGWRLPTIQELASLVDPTRSELALPKGHPFNVKSAVYWSATTYATDTTMAYGVHIGYGGIYIDTKTVYRDAWCVRGGQGVDPQ